MAKKRGYSDQQRADALALLDANGGDVSKAAAQAGVPRMTLSDWAKGRVHPAVTDIRQEKKGHLADLFEGFARDVLRLTTPEDIQGATLRDRFVAAGIAVDKMQLLRGDPTSINLGNDLDALIAAELARLAGRGEGGPAGAAAADADARPPAAPR